MPLVIDYPDGRLEQGDVLDLLARARPQSVDMVFGSPPYEDARLYGEVGFTLRGQDWVDWMFEVYTLSLRACRGLVAFVIGHGKGARDWSATPALLVADLKRNGITLRSPAFYKRNGIMGSGGKDWLRADCEWIVCATNSPDLLPWSDNTACGHPPKFPPGGALSYRMTDGTRVRVRRLMEEHGITQREAARRAGVKLRISTSGRASGDTELKRGYVPPELVNPGNVVDCGAVGGGRMGSNIAHENEAPFPLRVPDLFIRSFCPPAGKVWDPFCGSGTTIEAAVRAGRHFVGTDLRLSQVRLTERRVRQARNRKGFGL